jgi:acetolactate synthase-1/2/3 large subunit
MTTQTGAGVLIAHLAARGVKHIYGVPGGDCSLDLIAAAEKAGIHFVLTRTENSGAMMACAESELTGTLGVLLTTRGPGIANAANGIAYASLDRTPLLIISDAYENNLSFVSHQRFDQVAMLAPLVRASLRLEETTSLPAIGPLLDMAFVSPAGPVYVEVTGACMRQSVPKSTVAIQATLTPLPVLLPENIEAARKTIAGARRPIIIAGLQSRDKASSDALRRFAAKLNCPVYATYKAKGVLPDTDPLMTGYFINGAAEEDDMRSADLIITYGLDPIELPPTQWKYDIPIVELTNRPFNRNYFVPAVLVVGDLAQAISKIESAVTKSKWDTKQLAAAKKKMKTRAEAKGGNGITPQLLVETASAHMPKNAQVTVDAGVHMLAVVAFYDAVRPRDLLISRGLATMAFALPAAIGAAMADPSRHVVALTGDGGLLMCAAELSTAVQLGCKLTVVVFNDAAITMIGLKQHTRGFDRIGMDYPATDYSLIGEGFGCKSFRVEDPAKLAQTLKKAFAIQATTVVDVVLDPTPYYQQLRSMRG